MHTENILSEWRECRDTISRFDGYLLKTRLLGISVFAIVYTAIAVFMAESGSLWVFPHASFMYALIALQLFIATIYMIDRYYERMLLVAVLRASRLEAHQFEDFRVGLTTEIEFQKGQFDKPHWSAKFARASSMVNLAYGSMLALVIVEFMAMTWKSLHHSAGVLKAMPFGVSAMAVMIVFVVSNRLLREQKALIQKRLRVVSSPVVYSKVEIDAAVDHVACQICEWMHAKEIKTLNVISILTGARPFTEGLLSRMREIDPGVDFRVVPVRIEATRNNVAEGKAKICYGYPDLERLGNIPTIIVDDLVDTGSSLKLMQETLESLGTVDAKTAVLINKYAGAKFEADFVGFDLGLKKEDLVQRGISDYWLFGFGMDIDGAYRELEHIGWVPIEKG